MHCLIRALATGAILLVLLAGTGCESKPKVVRVTGTLRHNKEPVAGIMLYFVPDEGRLSWGFTNQDGQYELEYDKKTKGALVASHKVYLIYRPEDSRMRGITPYPGAQALLAKYGNLETTPLRYEVKENGQVIDIDLD
jgi:hypothetical protein